MIEKFTLFYAASSPFSNWHIATFVDENELVFNCTEKFMMYHKAMTFGDTEVAAEVMAASHPREQKALGRKVRNFKSETWDAISRAVVYKGCYFKFEQNPKLKAQLLATSGTTLVEASPADVIWGIGLGENDPDARDRSKWRGTNWLGEVLTMLREDYLNGTVKI